MAKTIHFKFSATGLPASAGPARARRLAMTTALGFGVLAAGVGLTVSPALAICVLAADIVCSGVTGANPSPGFGNVNSVTFIKGETQKNTTGLVVFGGTLAPTTGFSIDATSSITASTAAGSNDGSAVFLSNNFGAITTTTPTFTGISGNLKSTIAAGLTAITGDSAGEGGSGPNGHPSLAV